MRKPFDVLAEGPSVPFSGGNRTPIELFLAGLANWDGQVRRLLSHDPLA
jgi:hypothetical protein